MGGRGLRGSGLSRKFSEPHLVRLELRVTPEQLQRLDAERIPDARGVPTRAALFRELLDEGLAWRKASRRLASFFSASKLKAYWDDQN
jgi:hypothetical protein